MFPGANAPHQKSGWPCSVKRHRGPESPHSVQRGEHGEHVGLRAPGHCELFLSFTARSSEPVCPMSDLTLGSYI